MTRCKSIPALNRLPQMPTMDTYRITGGTARTLMDMQSGESIAVESQEVV